MPILTLVCLTLSSAVLIPGIRNLRNTTLFPAGCWALAGLAAWWCTAFCDVLQITGPGGVDGLYYMTAVLLLCPGIAVLGARRPGYQVWNIFVLLPLLAVQIFPVIASTRFLDTANQYRLDLPALLGFSLVLVMGTANYYGTRFTLPALLHSSTLVLIVFSMTDTTASLMPAADAARQCAVVTFTLSTVLAALRGGDSNPGLSGLDQVWRDFVDQFGLMWAHRVMVRLNEAAVHESWVAEFHWHGIQWAPDATVSERIRTQERITLTLRWLLKRYVTSEWIDARLLSADDISVPQHSPDTSAEA